MHKGQCLCGAVKIATAEPVDKIRVCHCSMCQIWHGGPGFNVACGNKLHIEGQEAITTYAASSAGERAFCKQCGTHLFYHAFKPSSYYVSASLFEDSKSAQLAIQFYIDCKPEYYNFVEQTQMLTEQDIVGNKGFSPDDSGNHRRD